MSESHPSREPGRRQATHARANSGGSMAPQRSGAILPPWRPAQFSRFPGHLRSGL
jgi:hypothetical protein